MVMAVSCAKVPKLTMIIGGSYGYVEGRKRKEKEGKARKRKKRAGLLFDYNFVIFLIS